MGRKEEKIKLGTEKFKKSEVYIGDSHVASTCYISCHALTHGTILKACNLKLFCNFILILCMGVA